MILDAGGWKLKGSGVILFILLAGGAIEVEAGGVALNFDESVLVHF